MGGYDLELVADTETVALFNAYFAVPALLHDADKGAVLLIRAAVSGVVLLHLAEIEAA